MLNLNLWPCVLPYALKHIDNCILLAALFNFSIHRILPDDLTAPTLSTLLHSFFNWDISTILGTMCLTMCLTMSKFSASYLVRFCMARIEDKFFNFNLPYFQAEKNSIQFNFNQYFQVEKKLNPIQF